MVKGDGNSTVFLTSAIFPAASVFPAPFLSDLHAGRETVALDFLIRPFVVRVNRARWFRFP